MGNKSSDTSCVYSVGYSRYSEVGKNVDQSSKLHKITDKINIMKIISGREYAIYIDDNNDFWGLGRNTNGELCIPKHGPSLKDKTIHHLTKIDYFIKNNIKIEKICTNVNCVATFWITDTSKVYVSGANHAGRFGNAPETNKGTPYLIKELNNVVGITCNWNYTFVLCLMDATLLQTHQNLLSALPHDICNLIVEFCGNDVFVSTIHYDNNPCYQYDEKYWIRFDIFDDKSIIKVESWSAGCLFLDARGIIWSLRNGQRNLNKIDKFQRITIDGTVSDVPNLPKIVDIKCGDKHFLALDDEGDAWSWGENTSFPTLMNCFVDKNVVEIGCGSRNSYAKTDDNKYYDWGDNKNKQCLNNPDGDECSVPKEIQRGKILAVSLGDRNAKIIIQ